MSEDKLTLIKIDYENNSDWWGEARESKEQGNAPSAVVPLLDVAGPDEIIVGQEVATEILRWAESLPLWADPGAPDHAPHPLLFHDHSEDSA